MPKIIHNYLSFKDVFPGNRFSNPNISQHGAAAGAFEAQIWTPHRPSVGIRGGFRGCCG